MPIAVLFTGLKAMLHPRCCLLMNCVWSNKTLGFVRPLVAPSSPENRLRNLQVWDIHSFAWEQILMAMEIMKMRYDINAIEHEFYESDKVWLWNLVRCKGLIVIIIQYIRENKHTILTRLIVVIFQIIKSLSSK